MDFPMNRWSSQTDITTERKVQPRITSFHLEEHKESHERREVFTEQRESHHYRVTTESNSMTRETEFSNGRERNLMLRNPPETTVLEVKVTGPSAADEPLNELGLLNPPHISRGYRTLVTHSLQLPRDTVSGIMRSTELYPNMERRLGPALWDPEQLSTNPAYGLLDPPCTSDFLQIGRGYRSSATHSLQLPMDTVSGFPLQAPIHLRSHSPITDLSSIERSLLFGRKSPQGSVSSLQIHNPNF